MSDTTPNTTERDRQALSREVLRQVGGRTHYMQLVEEVTGKVIAAHEHPTLEELQAISEAVPAYVERVAAEEAARIVVVDTSAAARVAHLEDAIRAGETVAPAALAQARAEAQAEADVATIAEAGHKAREKSARELQKAQAKALDEVRKSLPALPSDVEDRVAAAEKAIAHVLEAAAEYGAQVSAAHETLTTSGVVAREYGQPTDYDGDNHPLGRSFGVRAGVVVDGVTYSEATEVDKLRRRLAEAVKAA